MSKAENREREEHVVKEEKCLLLEKQDRLIEKALDQCQKTLWEIRDFLSLLCLSSSNA